MELIQVQLLILSLSLVFVSGNNGLKPQKNKKPIEETKQNQIECYRGMPHQSPREKFLLWDRIPALCDTETDDGGWIIIQRRTTGDVDFYRNWADYKNGFGTTDTDFWIGNDVIHNLTSQGYIQLRIDMIDDTGSFYACYDYFTVADEPSKYKLRVGSFWGNTTDSLVYHDNNYFSTFDNRNDNLQDNTSCAVTYHGAWWYDACLNSNLNAEWGVQDYYGIWWYMYSLSRYCTFTEMKVRYRVQN